MDLNSNTTGNSTGPGFGIDNRVSTRQLRSGLILNGFLGGCFLIAFIVLQAVTATRFYRQRLLYNHSITVKPPPLPFRNFRALYAWLVVVLTISDGEIQQAAGLDALVMVKSAALGVQLLVPMCILVTGTLAPIHRAGTHLVGGRAAEFDSLMTYTIANLGQGSHLMWVHMVLTYVFIGYAMFLLWWHYKQYLVARQNYLIRGEEPTYRQCLVEDDISERRQPSTIVNKVEAVKRVRWEEGSGTTRGPPRSTDKSNPGPYDPDRPRCPSSSSQVSRHHSELPSKRSCSDRPSDVEATHCLSPDKSHGGLLEGPVGGQTPAVTGLGPSGPPHQAPSAVGPGSGDIEMLSRLDYGPGMVKGPEGLSCRPPDASCACHEGTAGHPVLGQDMSPNQKSTGLPSNSVLEAVRSQDQVPPSPLVMIRGPVLDNACRAMACSWWRDIPKTILPQDMQEKINQDWLTRPSVRHIKMVNTLDSQGRRVPVNAQYYAVLITNVDQSLFPELDKPHNTWALRLMSLLNRQISVSTTAEPTWFRTYPAWLVNYVRSLAGHPARSPKATPVSSAASAQFLGGATLLTRRTASLDGVSVASLPHRPITSSRSGMSYCQPPGSIDTPCAVILNHFDIEEGLGHLQSQLPYKGWKTRREQSVRRTQPEPLREIQGGLPCDMRDAPKQEAAICQTEDQGGQTKDQGDLWAVKDPSPEVKLHPEPSGLHGWALVRKAVRQGRVQSLLLSERYSIVTATFKRLFPDAFDRAIPVIRHFEVEMMLNQRDLLELNMQRAVMKEGRIGGPAMERERCCGPRVNIVEARQKALRDLDDRIVKERSKAWQHGQTRSWFVFFKTQEAAIYARNALIHAVDSPRFQVHPAPGPDEVNWPHLWHSQAQRDMRSMLCQPLMWLVVLFPIAGMLGALSQAEFVVCQTSALRVLSLDWFCTPTGLFLTMLRRLITSWLPTVLLQLYQLMALPRLIFLVAQGEGGHYSLSELDRRIGAIYFYWDIGNVFLGGLLGTGSIQQVLSIIDAPDKVFEILGAAIPGSANFFLQYVALRCLLVMPLKFMLPHGNVWMNWVRFIFCAPCCCSCCHTEQDNAMMFFPKSIRYGIDIGILLLIFTIVICFSIIAPLVLPWGVLYFILAWVFWRYAVLYIFTRKYESGGTMWPLLFNRMCFILGMFAIFNISVLLVKQAYAQGILMLCTLPWMIYKFYSSCRRFELGVNGVPLEVAHLAPVAHVDPLMYIPRPLREGAWGWRPEWMKVWEGWGMPAYPVNP